MVILCYKNIIKIYTPVTVVSITGAMLRYNNTLLKWWTEIAAMFMESHEIRIIKLKKSLYLISLN